MKLHETIQASVHVHDVYNVETKQPVVQWSQSSQGIMTICPGQFWHCFWVNPDYICVYKTWLVSFVTVNESVNFLANSVPVQGGLVVKLQFDRLSFGEQSPISFFVSVKIFSPFISGAQGVLWKVWLYCWFFPATRSCLDKRQTSCFLTLCLAVLPWTNLKSVKNWQRKLKTLPF